MDREKVTHERDRLQGLLDSYEAGRVTHFEEDKRRELKRDVTPDRADNVRARIARLDRILSEANDA